MKNESEDGSLSDQFEEMPKIPRIRPKVNDLHYFDLIMLTSRHSTSTAMNLGYLNDLQCGLIRPRIIETSVFGTQFEA